MNVNVFCDDQKVFSGPLSEFLAYNDNDEDLTQACAALSHQEKIELFEISAHWEIVRTPA